MATGPEHYAALAGRAAESLRRHMPGLAVDLFSDRRHDLPVFDRIHVLPEAWERSKIDALRLSRFARTLYLDSDIIVVADIGDLFEVLDRFDVALAHDAQRNGEWAYQFWRRMPPPAFAQFNSGVMALRRNAATQSLLETWAEAVRDHGIGRDQPALRELLWESDLRIATLPEEYNYTRFQSLSFWGSQNAAPRVIHSPQFHREFARYSAAFDPVTERLGLSHGARLQYLLSVDRGLAQRAGQVPRSWSRRERRRWVMRRLPGRLVSRLKRALGR